MGEILFNFYAQKKDEKYSKATANVLAEMIGKEIEWRRKNFVSYKKVRQFFYYIRVYEVNVCW